MLLCLVNWTLSDFQSYNFGFFFIGGIAGVLNVGHCQAEIVETTLVVSRFRFFRVVSRISEVCVIILPGMQICIRRNVGKTKVVSTIYAARVTPSKSQLTH